MTSAQRKQHKLGNQLRKIHLQTFNKKKSGRHFNSIQNGSYTYIARKHYTGVIV